MPHGVHWFVWAHAVAGATMFALAAYTWWTPDRPGRDYWIVTLLFMGVATVGYGVGLLAPQPGLRWLLELITLGGILWAAICYLGFSLAYTGREHVLNGRAYSGLLATGALVTLLGATNPGTHLLWQELRVVPVAGMATVQYAIQPLLYGVAAGVYVIVGLGAFALVETAMNHTSSFARRLVIFAMVPVVPLVAGLAWLFDLGPYPAVNLIPLAFLPHVVVDVYALFVRDILEVPAGLQRTGRLAAIDDLATPVVTVATDGRVVSLNDAAEDLFDETEEGARTDQVSDLFGTAVDPEEGDTQVTLAVDGELRRYKLSVSPFSSEGGSHRGFTITVQDITTEMQRKQRLDVLNRVLRHNLRNDLNVVRLQAERLEATVSDPSQRDHLEAIRSVSADLIELGEKARWATRALEDTTFRTVEVRPMLEDVVADVTAGTDAAVTIDAPEGLTLYSDPELLTLVFTSIVENAIEHNDTPEPCVRIGVRDGDDWTTIDVDDDGPGIPEGERAVIQNGRESALEHGSGIGLWLVHWGVTVLGGEVTFEVDDGGTTVSVRIPDTRKASQGAPASSEGVPSD